ncbi:ATP-dependent DNA ligase [Phenylobacterium sp. LjRoot164]|uniref:ATP-dependent DNA ligase n=1 Tax=unclassified Phenylobacterium TaxID=2640670 RepID=UPI003ECF0759
MLVKEASYKTDAEAGARGKTSADSVLGTVSAPMEARSQPALPDGEGWWFEPKWDGFRCLLARGATGVQLQSKSGKDLVRYFPEIAAAAKVLAPGPYVLDGELLAARDGAFSFEALQDRLHPAESRIRRLAAEAPAMFTAFDLLQTPEADLRGQPFERRRAELVQFLARHANPRFSLTHGTRERSTADAWLGETAVEGVVAKRLDEPYRPGERAWVKVKRRRTADCVVGGFRYAKNSGLVGSLLLGLYDEQGRLNLVGFVSGFAGLDKTALTARLEALEGPPGFTGAAPGPSRWSTDRSADWRPLRPELVVEVEFDHASGHRMRHGARFVRFRPDKSPEQCRMEQLDV